MMTVKGSSPSVDKKATTKNTTTKSSTDPVAGLEKKFSALKKKQAKLEEQVSHLLELSNAQGKQIATLQNLLGKNTGHAVPQPASVHLNGASPSPAKKKSVKKADTTPTKAMDSEMSRNDSQLKSIANRFESGAILREDSENRAKNFAGKEFDRSVFGDAAPAPALTVEAPASKKTTPATATSTKTTPAATTTNTTTAPTPARVINNSTATEQMAFAVSGSARTLASRFETGEIGEETKKQNQDKFSGKEFDKSVFKASVYTDKVESDDEPEPKYVAPKYQPPQREDEPPALGRASSSARNLANRFETGAIAEEDIISHSESFKGKEFDRSVFAARAANYPKAAKNAPDQELTESADHAEPQPPLARSSSSARNIANRFESGAIAEEDTLKHAESFKGKEFDASVIEERALRMARAKGKQV